jgi:hypothetical protein
MFRKDSLVTFDYPHHQVIQSAAPVGTKQRRYGMLALLRKAFRLANLFASLPYSPVTFVLNVILHHAVTLLLTVAVTQSRNTKLFKEHF